MKFPRAIRLDGSDVEVYERAARPGEWTVPGSFVFLDVEPSTLEGKALQAFKGGFLGTETFGWSTLVEIADIDEDEYSQVIDRIAAYLIEHHGAPHIAAALPVAGEEADYATTICEYPLSTLLAIERDFSDEGLSESLKVIRPSPGARHDGLKLWGVEQG